MTVDVTTMEKSEVQRGQYGLLLNPKGRAIMDAFIYKPFLAGQRDEFMEYWV
eukprot:CAMPEP_0168346980 /NCGR_PEP_ID=MMETSP0213-20121227/18670_1 /TAXON_ID=151035 /ORGANISM="Euplotes harpa, Strain FSP1.4" /LENGTH=51 /DNA_ID=CAMNT_0008355887 /DNA_START=18 /DNA_END=169 /DNA_ORIENTATION=+